MWNLNIIALHLNWSMVWLWRERKETRDSKCIEYILTLTFPSCRPGALCKYLVLLLFPSHLACLSSTAVPVTSFSKWEMCPRVTEASRRRVWRGGMKLVFKDHDLCTKWEESRPSCCSAAVCGLETLGFRVLCRVVLVRFFLSLKCPLPPPLLLIIIDI